MLCSGVAYISHDDLMLLDRVTPLLDPRIDTHASCGFEHILHPAQCVLAKPSQENVCETPALLILQRQKWLLTESKP